MDSEPGRGRGPGTGSTTTKRTNGVRGSPVVTGTFSRVSVPREGQSPNSTLSVFGVM